MVGLGLGSLLVLLERSVWIMVSLYSFVRCILPRVLISFGHGVVSAEAEVIRNM